MKRLIAVATIASLTFSSAFAEIPKIGPATPPDPIKEQQRRLEKRAAKLRRTGGRVVDMNAMKGTFRFINLQKRIPSVKMKDVVDRLGRQFMSDFSLIDGEESFTIEKATKVLVKKNATAGVFVIDTQGLPTVLVAPEAKWALVNVAALAADGVDQMKLERRVRRELLRAFAALAGGGGSMDPLCVSHTATTLKELDAIKSNDLSYDPLVRAEEALKVMGITPYRRITYREACEEGWAPAPTNDIQKAIWEQVRSDKERGPTNPIRIPRPSEKK